MVLGNGDIASVLPDRHDLLFFASGVSNSQETREEEYQREVDLLNDQNDLSHIVYFSSLSVFYSKTRYAQHKREMEMRIRQQFGRWTIVRLGNITWGDNPHTIINFIRNKIKKNEEFDIRNEYRYIIDKDEFLHWILKIPEWSCEMNITGTRMTIEEIVTKYGYINTAIK